jgi:hypothetical protein
MISIDNVTKRQKRLLDIMWSLDTKEDYDAWFNGLSEELQDEADLLMRLMVLASVEEDLGDMKEAKSVLKQFTVRGTQ